MAHASPRAQSTSSQPSNSQITHFKTGLESNVWGSRDLLSQHQLQIQSLQLPCY